jgi:hypothetical protein
MEFTYFLTCMSRYLWLVREEDRFPAVTIASEVLDIWNKANIPSLTSRHIQGKVLKLYEDFRFLNNHISFMTQEKKKIWFLPKLESFKSSLPELFDLLPQEQYICNAIARTQIPYGKEEKSLYLDQKDKKFEMTLGGVDSKWAKMQAKRIKRRQQEENRVQHETDRVLQETVPSTSQIDDAIEPEGDIEVLEDEYEWHAPGTRIEKQKVIMTRQKQKNFDAFGEVKVVTENEWTVRDSYLNIHPEIFDLLINSMAKANLTANQALQSAQIFASHYLKVTWYLEGEANALKKKAEKEGKEPPDYRYVLPCHSTLCRRRRLYALYGEMKIGETILKANVVTQHGDSTTRSVVGKVFTAPLTIDHNLTVSLPIVELKFETADDVARLYHLYYQRLQILTGKPATEIFSKVDAIMTDSASEMNKFIPILREYVGSSHDPHHLKCAQHSVLGFAEAMLKCISAIENNIGPSKLYGASNCHDKSNVTKSTIVAILKLISPQYRQKPYNLKEEFDALLNEAPDVVNEIERGFEFSPRKNYAKAHRSCRFDALPRDATIVNFHWQDLKRLVDRVASRNDLIIFIRTMLECDFVKIAIMSFALMGIHLIEPYLDLVSNASHTELQEVFKNLFSEMQAFAHKTSGRSLTQSTECAFPSLRPYFERVRGNKVYVNEWIQVLQADIDALNEGNFETLCQLLVLQTNQCAITLERQRGPAYFPKNGEATAEDVSRVPPEKLKMMPATNILSENSLGILDRLLSILGNNVQCASDYMLIRSAGHMILWYW